VVRSGSPGVTLRSVEGFGRKRSEDIAPTLNESKIHSYTPELQQKVGELVLFITYCYLIIILEKFFKLLYRKNICYDNFMDLYNFSPIDLHVHLGGYFTDSARSVSQELCTTPLCSHESLISGMCRYSLLLLPRHYSPGWALASLTMRLHSSLLRTFSPSSNLHNPQVLLQVM
jgi:hypothetical protein